jgi:hypothetical protein
MFKLGRLEGYTVDFPKCKEDRQLENISEFLISSSVLIGTLQLSTSMSSVNKRRTDTSAMEARNVFSIGCSVRK